MREVRILDFFNKDYPMLALDISVNSTGYVLYDNGKIDFGTFTIPKNFRKSDNDIRCAFRFMLYNLINKVSDIGSLQIFIEDVFAGKNYNTLKILARLNTVVDDLILDGFLNIPIGNVKRTSNKSWKSLLKKLSGYTSEIKGQSDKDDIRGSLLSLGIDDIFNATDENKVIIQDGLSIRSNIPKEGKYYYPQDVYDAFGIMIWGAFGAYEQKAVKANKLPSLKSQKLKVYYTEEDYLKNLPAGAFQLGDVVDLDRSWSQFSYTGEKIKKPIVGFSTKPYYLGVQAFYDNFQSLQLDFSASKLWFIVGV